MLSMALPGTGVAAELWCFLEPSYRAVVVARYTSERDDVWNAVCALGWSEPWGSVCTSDGAQRDVAHRSVRYAGCASGGNDWPL